MPNTTPAQRITRALGGCLNTAFEDKRVVTVVMVAIIAATVAAFVSSDQSTKDFLRVGPSPQTKILGIKIDSWAKWQLAIALGTLITVINDFISVSLGPFFINTILDPKERKLPYSKFTCIVIHIVRSVYSHVFSLLGLSMMLSQVDFWAVKSSSDLVVGTFGLLKYIEHKEYCPSSAAAGQQQAEDLRDIELETPLISGGRKDADNAAAPRPLGFSPPTAYLFEYTPS